MVDVMLLPPGLGLKQLRSRMITVCDYPVIFFFDFAFWKENPMEFTCNASSPCRVLPFDSLFAILDCAPESHMEADRGKMKAQNTKLI